MRIEEVPTLVAELIGTGDLLRIFGHANLD